MAKMRADKGTKRPEPNDQESVRQAVSILQSVSMEIERSGSLVVLRFGRGGMVMLRPKEARLAAKLLRSASKKVRQGN